MKRVENPILAGFYLRKFKSYLFNLKRVGQEYKKDFLIRFIGEFEEAKAAGELDLSFFSEKEARLLHSLMKDPDMFLSDDANITRPEYLRKEKERFDPDKAAREERRIYKTNHELSLLGFTIREKTKKFFKALSNKQAR